jgi:hypothetical protein
MARPVEGYRNAAGERIPSVTTITKRFQESGGLLQWAFRQGQDGKANLYEDAKKAADVGTLAHSMVEAYINDRTEVESKTDDPNLITQARTAFAAFKEWRDQVGFEIKHTELSLVSEKYQFGGTIDAIGWRKYRHVLGDWKTGNGIYSDALIQVAAYAILWDEHHSDEPINGFFIGRFSRDYPDFSHRYYAELDKAKQAFILMRKLYDIDKELKKRVG